MGPNSSTGGTQALKQRNRELSILNAIARALNAEVRLDRALETALAQVAELLDLETGWVWLLEEESGESYLAASQNLPPGLALHPETMEGSCYCLDTFRAGDLGGAANVNVVTCSRLRALVDGTDGLRYHASIPLYAHGRRLGVMNVASTNWRQLSQDDLQLLYTIGDLLGIAVERARLYARSAEAGALKERNRLAREIHDTLAQGLTAIALQLETLDALLEGQPEAERLRGGMRRALELTRGNLEEARRSVLDLRAAPLQGRSLADALHELAAQMGGDAGVAIAFELSGTSRPLPIRVEAGLYRIAQESLANILQHAEARNAYIRLALSPSEARLEVEDDGRGFNPKLVPPDRFGLVGLNERAHLLGGKLSLDTSPGEGTCLRVIVPLEAEA